MPSQPYKVLETSEAYEEVDGEYQFVGTLTVYRDDTNLYHGRMDGRSTLSTVKIEDLTNVTLIPTTAYRPRVPPSFTKVPSPLPPDCYVKRPRLISYDRVQSSDNPHQIADRVLKECENYEILKQHPHPNIAEYLGLESSDGLISGICLTRYPQSLMKRVNPGSHMKRAFELDGKSLRDPDRVLQGIENGIRHLHKLNLIHNDLNPSNIMLLDDDTPIITDFDSCRRLGESLEGVGRTYEWYDDVIQLSLPQNDLDALNEMREWLSDKDTRKFQFKQ